jgi:methanogen homocitrate synthase
LALFGGENRVEAQWKSEHWWTSSYNFLPEIRAGFEVPERVKIHDGTLRDGEQTRGVVLRKDDKMRIAELLDDIGVDGIEAGMPAVSAEDADAIKAIAKRVKRADVYAFVRAISRN